MEVKVGEVSYTVSDQLSLQGMVHELADMLPCPDGQLWPNLCRAHEALFNSIGACFILNVDSMSAVPKHLRSIPPNELIPANVFIDIKAARRELLKRARHMLSYWHETVRVLEEQVQEGG